MEMIPSLGSWNLEGLGSRPFLPLAYTDFGIQESHWMSPRDRGGSAPSAEFRITVHTPSSVPSWAGDRGSNAWRLGSIFPLCTRPYSAFPESSVLGTCPDKRFSLVVVMHKINSGRVPPRRITVVLLCPQAVFSPWLLFLQKNVLQPDLSSFL